MITVAIEPRTIRILPRGNWLDESGPIVAPAVPAFLGALDTGERRPTRLDLANWLTDREHGIGGLTARVFANRFWYLLFGRGLAPVLDDFGGQGEPPAHPQLLDNLAVEFLESGWNVKQMMRMLVMSDAYRRSSVPTAELARKDPENRWFARQSRFRLPAESIRDTALSIGGLLVNEFGGASVRPYQPAGYYRHLNFPRRKYEHDQDQRQWRRGVYVHWQRQFLHPTFRALDAPSREECTAQRPRSNTPNAALALLNDPTFVEAARALAQQMLADDSLSPTQRQVAAFRRVVSRPPNSAERELMASYLARMQSHYKEHPEEAAKLLQVGMHPLDESLDADALAAWTMLGRALLNMSETITRN